METNDRLKYLRAKAGYTQAEVGAKLGLSRQAYAGLEKGQSVIKKQHLETLSQMYRCSIDFLLGNADSSLEKALSDSEKEIIRLLRDLNNETTNRCIRNLLENMRDMERRMVDE